MNMPTIPESKKKSFQLDCVKAIAIVMIVAFHFWGQLSGWHMQVVRSDWLFSYFQNFSFEKFLRFIEAYFYLGVNLFVIASGFGLYLSHLREKKIFQWNYFLKKRFLRLLPAAIISIIFVFFFKGFLLNNWATERWHINFFPFIGGLNLLSDQWFFPPVNGETWFLGLVIQLYLIFPFLTWLYEKNWLKKFGAAKFLIFLFIMSAGFRVWYFISLQYSVSSLSYGFFLGRIFEFGFGMICAKNFYQGKNISRWWILGILAFLGYFFPLIFPFADSLLGIGLFTLLWIIADKIQTVKNNHSCNAPSEETSCSNLKKINVKIQTKTITEKISTQSYIIFLIHHPIIWLINKWGLTDFWNLKGIMLFFIVFFVSYKIAYLLNQILCFFQIKTLKKPSEK